MVLISEDVGWAQSRAMSESGVVRNRIHYDYGLRRWHPARSGTRTELDSWRKEEKEEGACCGRGRSRYGRRGWSVQGVSWRHTRSASWCRVWCIVSLLSASSEVSAMICPHIHHLNILSTWYLQFAIVVIFLMNRLFIVLSPLLKFWIPQKLSKKLGRCWLGNLKSFLIYLVVPSSSSK